MLPLKPHRLVGHADARIVDALLAVEGIDVNHQDRTGCAPLHTTQWRMPTQPWSRLFTLGPMFGGAFPNTSTTKRPSTEPATTVPRSSPGTPDGRGLLFQSWLQAHITYECRVLLAIAHPSALPPARRCARCSGVFHSGVDYWQRRLHAYHSWAMRQAVLTRLMIAQRSHTQHALAAQHRQPSTTAPQPPLPPLPEEI